MIRPLPMLLPAPLPRQSRSMCQEARQKQWVFKKHLTKKYPELLCF